MGLLRTSQPGSAPGRGSGGDQVRPPSAECMRRRRQESQRGPSRVAKISHSRPPGETPRTGLPSGWPGVSTTTVAGDHAPAPSRVATNTATSGRHSALPAYQAATSRSPPAPGRDTTLAQ